MDTMAQARRARRLRRCLLLGLLAAVGWLVVGAASPAWAHAYLVDSDPDDGEVLAAAPDELVLKFNESVRPVAERFVVVAPDGEPVDAGPPEADGATVRVPLGDAGARGTYLVSFRVISADSHPAGGAFTFSVGAPSEPPELPTAADSDDPALRTAMSAARYAGYAGLVLVVGPVAVLVLMWPQRLSRRGPARLVWTGVGLIAVSTAVALWLQAPYSAGTAPLELSGADLGGVLGSTSGQAYLIRLGALAAAVFLLRPVVTGRAARADLVLLGALGLLALGSWPAAGHPIASPLPAISVVLAMVHLAAAAFWVGGLVMLVGFLLRQATDRELGAILPVWSGWAATAVLALLVAGLIQAVIEVAASPEALVSTGYGQLLLGKTALVAVVVGVAAVSRRIVRERAAARRPGLLRAAVVAEAALLAVVMAVAAVLVYTTPARVAVVAPEGVSTFSDYITTVDTDLYSLEVTVEPAEQGPNTVHLYAFTVDGEPLPVVEWGATAALPDAGIEPLDIPLQRLSDNHVLGEVSLPAAGEWRFRFTVRISEIDQESVLVDVPVS